MNLRVPKMRGIFATSWPNTSFSRRVVTDNIPDLYWRWDLFEARLGHTLSSGLPRCFSFLQTNSGSLNIEQVTTASFQTLSNSLLQQSSNRQYSQSDAGKCSKKITKYKCSKNLVSVGGGVPVSNYIICNVCQIWFSFVRIRIVPKVRDHGIKNATWYFSTIYSSVDMVGRNTFTLIPFSTFSLSVVNNEFVCCPCCYF
jgi:hypothetical protein